jgi:hypothetical protein
VASNCRIAVVLQVGPLKGVDADAGIGNYRHRRSAERPENPLRSSILSIFVTLAAGCTEQECGEVPELQHVGQDSVGD